MRRLLLRSAAFPWGLIQIVTVPVPGLPGPQLVLQAAGQPPNEWPVVWDCRALGESLYIIR